MIIAKLNVLMKYDISWNVFMCVYMLVAYWLKVRLRDATTHFQNFNIDIYAFGSLCLQNDELRLLIVWQLNTSQ